MFTRVAFICSVLLFVSNVFSEEKSIEELIDLASESVSAIRSGEYIVRTHHQEFYVPPIAKSLLEQRPELRRQKQIQELLRGAGDSTKDRVIVFRIIFDADKQRIQREIGNRTTVYCTPYEKPDQAFFFMSRPYKLIGKEPGQFSNVAPAALEKLKLCNKKDFLELPQKVGVSEDTAILDIKTLGYIAKDIYSQSGSINIRDLLTRYVHDVSNNESLGLLITQENFKESQCVKITLTVEIRDPQILLSLPAVNEKGEKITLTEAKVKQMLLNTRSVLEIVLDPEKNYAIRRMVQHNSLVDIREILENDLKQDKSSGIWYPAHWTYERYSYDQLQVREENTLEVISINQKIDPKRFTLESLGDLLKPGTPVEWKLDTPPPGKGKLEWDGKQIFAHGEFGENWALQGTDPNQARRRWIIVVSVNIAVISLIFVLYYYRKYLRDR